MFLENSYIPKNTLVHNLNPLIKCIVFFTLVFLLFLRIPFSSQMLLSGFIFLIVWKSECKHIVKKIAPMYGILILFLFAVNFFFMKTPGFWTHNSLNDYRDILSLRATNTRTDTDDPVYYGWFFGGEVLRKSDGGVWIQTDGSCFNELIGLGSKSCEHSLQRDSLQNFDGNLKWNLVPIVTSTGTRYIAFAPFWYMISAMQIISAISLASKIIGIIILSSVFTATVSLSSFTYALEDFLRPLKIFKLPTKVIALSISIAIRFVPSLIGESLRVIKAQASRGIDYKNGKFRDKISALLSLFVPLFVISFIKSNELAEAMTSRGYDIKRPRTSFRIHLVQIWELLVLFVSMSFISVLYYFFFNGYYFGFFSDLEYLTFIAK